MGYSGESNDNIRRSLLQVLVSVFLGSFVWLTKHNHSFSVIYGGQCEGGRHVSV